VVVGVEVVVGVVEVVVVVAVVEQMNPFVETSLSAHT